MNNPTDDTKRSSDINEYLKQAKNDIHQKQQLFIAQKAYADALANEPATGDTSTQAEEARKNIETTRLILENLEQLVNGTITTSSS